MKNFSIESILAQRDLLLFYKYWHEKEKKWISHVSGLLDNSCVVKNGYSCRVINRGGKWYVENKNLLKKNLIVQPGIYDYIDGFKWGLARVMIIEKKEVNSYVETCEKWGLIDETGKEVLPVKYAKIIDFYKKERELTKVYEAESGSDSPYAEYTLNVRRGVAPIYFKPVEEWHSDKIIRTIMIFAKNNLNTDEIDDFEIVLEEMSDLERDVLKMLWLQNKDLSQKELIDGVLSWNANHWQRGYCYYRDFFYEDANKYLSDFDKIVFFWKYILDDMRKFPKLLDQHFPKEYRIYSEENLKKLYDLMHSYYKYTCVSIDSTAGRETDAESAIMGALSHGNGDLVGY